MEKARVIKILIVVVVLFAVAGFFGLYFFKGSSDDSLLTIENIGAASAEGGEIFQALNDLKSLKIDDSVFNIPGYDKLEDFSTTVQTEEKQRPNPYAPIGSEIRPSLPSAPGTPKTTKKVPNE